MSSGRRFRAALITPVVLVVGGVSAAWACTPATPELAVIGMAEMPPGSQATVQGTNYPAQSTVELRWASTGGARLTSASGPGFTATFTIPAAAKPGLYSVMAVWKASDGQPSHNAATIEVTGASQTTPPPPPPPRPGNGPSDPPSGEGAPATPDATSDQIPSSNPAQSGPASLPSAGPGAVAAGTNASTRRVAPASATGQTSRSASSSRPGLVPTSDPGSTALSPPAPTNDPAAATAAPRVAVVMDDLWRGFTSGDATGPGLAGRDPAGAAGNGRTVGLGLMGAAGLAIAGALVGAGFGRRRTGAVADSGNDA